MRIGWQVIPEFHVSQDGTSKGVLEVIQKRLGCGHIKLNHAGSGRDKTCVLVIRKRQDLQQKVIPFFKRYPLYTEKWKDFVTFSKVVHLMMANKHLSRKGFSAVVDLAYSMNKQGRYRRVGKEEILTSLKSSETIRSTLARKIGG